MQKICKEWRVTEQEYFDLEKQFGRLCEKQAWVLLQKNCKNNHTDEQTDVAQEMRVAMIRAGSYYKRQMYIQKCLKVCHEYAYDKGKFIRYLWASLADLWKNKTRHGANRQKFGPPQEELLTKLVRKIVPKSEWPDKKAPLPLTPEFFTYCKSITWNAQKALGKKITREKVIRSQMASLSEFDYLGSI